MRIAFCTPLKPVHHPNLSGDVTIARDLHDFLCSRGHELLPVPQLFTRDLPASPARWPELLRARRETLAFLRETTPDLWLTYNTYYKVPDMLGPMAARRGLPYAIFCASYAENRARSADTLPGYQLNKRAMLAADRVFINRRADMATAAKLLPQDRYEFVRPGIRPADFSFDETQRRALRAGWGVGDTPVIVCAAMFRAGVKVEGVRHTLRALHRLAKDGRDFRLLLIGDGKRRNEVAGMVARTIPERTVLTGMVERHRLAAHFSAGDLFVFPGIEESIGMVYLEAQSAGLPCVAWDDAGAVDVIDNGRTGSITPAYDDEAFARAIDELLVDAEKRRTMSRAAQAFVRQRHDIDKTYGQVEAGLRQLVENARAARAVRTVPTVPTADWSRKSNRETLPSSGSQPDTPCDALSDTSSDTTRGTTSDTTRGTTSGTTSSSTSSTTFGTTSSSTSSSTSGATCGATSSKTFREAVGQSGREPCPPEAIPGNGGPVEASSEPPGPEDKSVHSSSPHVSGPGNGSDDIASQRADKSSDTNPTGKGQS